jgi:hypothetical protein
MMTSTATELPIHLAGSTLESYRHVCAFFTTPDEEYRVMLPFVREGYERGDRSVHFVDQTRRLDHLTRLREAGLDVDAAEHSGHLEVRSSQETYLRHGRFDPEAMLARIEETLDAGASEGFPLTRLVGHAEQVLDDAFDAAAFLEYESRLNQVLSRHADPVICTYDARRMGAGIALDVLRTHPVAIIAGVLQKNPFYVSTDEFLLELHERKAHRANRPEW